MNSHLQGLNNGYSANLRNFFSSLFTSWPASTLDLEAKRRRTLCPPETHRLILSIKMFLNKRASLSQRERGWGGGVGGFSLLLVH